MRQAECVDFTLCHTRWFSWSFPLKSHLVIIQPPNNKKSVQAHCRNNGHRSVQRQPGQKAMDHERLRHGSTRPPRSRFHPSHPYPCPQTPSIDFIPSQVSGDIPTKNPKLLTTGSNSLRSSSKPNSTESSSQTCSESTTSTIAATTPPSLQVLRSHIRIFHISYRQWRMLPNTSVLD